eukprot:GHVT01069999.1.p1 GENE.GHVT01069999.1~~GHVT01069999.1.p1  ORF type:complete len:581 (+),score=7.76 GHVT01069999.1:175-1917(+)
MTKNLSPSKRFMTWTCDLVVYAKQVRYHFIIESPEKCKGVFTRRGMQNIHSGDEDDWVLHMDLTTPEWVTRSVFYQIVPDRFARGSPRLLEDRKTKVPISQMMNYVFDGHRPYQCKWEDPPATYMTGHCLDFYGGNLWGIADKLPYLRELGVSALYLTPIFQSCTTHRYDCNDYFQVDDKLGGDKALRTLVEEAHASHVRIILDVSINHTGTAHRWFQKANAPTATPEERGYYYMTESGEYKGWMGIRTLPQLDYTSSQVKDHMFKGENSVVTYWIKKFHIDGWRFDVGNHTGRNESDDMCHDIWRAVRKSVKSCRPTAYIVGECWEDYRSYVLGDQWDASMNYYGCLRPLRRWAGELDHFIQRAVADCHMPISTPKSTGYELMEQLGNLLFSIPSQFMFLQFNLLGSHDIHRLASHTAIYDMDIHKGLLIAQFLLPGTPCIYYGDEILLKGWLGAFEGCRYPMEWRVDQQDNRLFDTIQTLANLKREEPALHYGCIKFIYADSTKMAFCRMLGSTAIVAVLNHCSTGSSVNLPLDALGGTRVRCLLPKGDGNTDTVGTDGYQLDLGSCESKLLRVDIAL